MTSHRAKPCLAALALLLAMGITGSIAAGAEALGHIADTVSGLGRRPYGDVLQAYLGVMPHPDTGLPSEMVRFGSFGITGDGVSLELRREDDPDGWDALTRHLTNGLNESLYLGHTTSAHGGPVANVGRHEGPHPTMATWGLGEPDLAEWTIEFIRLQASGTSGVGSHWSYQRWEFWGNPIPEPVTMTLLAFGGLVLLKRKPRHPA